MLTDTARKGLATQLAVARRLVELGFEVLEPVGNHLRYDLAYYIPASSGVKAQLVRIQCKTARLSKSKNRLLFNTYNLGGVGKRQKRGYQGDAEYFGLYSHELQKVYLIKVDECHVGTIRLCLDNPGIKGKNRFNISVRLAKDYEI